MTENILAIENLESNRVIKTGLTLDKENWEKGTIRWSLGTVKIKLEEGAKFPEKKSKQAACYDLFSRSVVYDRKKDIYIYDTGIRLEMEYFTKALLYVRSSNRNTSCYMTNHVGTVDPDYRGIIYLSFKKRFPSLIRFIPNCVVSFLKTNTGIDLEKYLAKPPYEIGPDIAQAQMCFAPIWEVNWEIASELSSTERGEGGHGSTNIVK